MYQLNSCQSIRLPIEALKPNIIIERPRVWMTCGVC